MPYRYPLSKNLKEKLRQALAAVEPFRRKTYNWLLGSFVWSIIGAPFAFLFLVVGAKYHWFWWMAPVKPYLAFLFSRHSYSSRGQGRLIAAIIFGVGGGIYHFARSRVRKRLDGQVSPLVFNELHLARLPEGQYKRYFVKGTFTATTYKPENPISLEGHVGSLKFTASLVRIMGRPKQTVLQNIIDNNPPLETVFEGIHVVIPCRKNAWPRTLVCHPHSRINAGKLKPVPLSTSEAKTSCTVWSDNPQVTKAKLTTGFLQTITVWDGSPEDLPPLDMLVFQDHVELYIPEKMALFEPSYRLGMPYDSLDPVITMLTSWKVLKTQLGVLVTEFPELFGRQN